MAEFSVTALAGRERIFGHGSTPGLALRSFWRECERLWLVEGKGGAAHFLPRRRYANLWLRHFADREPEAA